MKTDELIDLLAAAQSPVDAGALDRALALAALAGLGLAAILVVATIGLRPDLSAVIFAGPVAAKFVFAGTLAVVAVLLYRRALRPGMAFGRLPLALVLTAGALGILALAQLVATPVEMRPAILFGESWTACIIFIPLYAILPYAILVAVGRKGAPLAPGRAGFVAGLASGALAGIAYALHCPEDTLPFVFAWYGGAMLFCAGIGALFGRPLLRW